MIESNFKDILGDLERDFDNMAKDLEKTVTKNKLLMKDIARTLVKEIKKRTLQGYGVEDGQAVGFDELKPVTIARRNLLNKKGKLDKRTSPSKSNQIESGKLIDSIHAVYGGNNITIQVKKDREEVLIGQINMGRDLMDLTDDQFQYVIDIIEDEVNELLKYHIGK